MDKLVFNPKTSELEVITPSPEETRSAEYASLDATQTQLETLQELL